MSTNIPFADQLEQFGEAQLASISTLDINASTVQLLLTTVFFTGAATSIAKLTNTPKKTYLGTLCTFLEVRFGLSSDQSSGMIESNARLYKRFVLIDKVYREGWHAARDERSQTNKLKDLLKKYQNLGMSDLNLEGTKKQTIKPQKLGKITPTGPEPLLAVPPSRWQLKVLVMILFILVGGVAYATFFPEQFSIVKSDLIAMLKELSKLL